MPYALAPGYNNAVGLISLTEIVNGGPPDSHATGLGTFRAANEFVNFDGVAEDDGYDTWEWRFVSLTTTDIEEIEDTILNGARSGPVTVETRGRHGAWVQRNAILTLPQLLPLQGIKFGGVVLTFTLGEPLP
jgi:hypothetical protein